MNANLRACVGASEHALFVEIDGVRIAYDDRGAGPVVIGLHATGHGSRDFELVADALAAHHRFVTLDWPGHGRSSADAKRFTATRCAEILLAFIDYLEIERATLIGNSIGGAAALIAAQRDPARIVAIVACNPGGLATIDAVAKTFCGLMARLGDAGDRGTWWFAPIFGAFCRLVLQTPPARPQRARIVRSGREVGKPMAQAWRSFADPAADITCIGGTIAQPVLFAWAMRDAFVSLAKSRAAIARFRDARIVTFGAGHCAYLERPAEFLAAFNAFERH